MSSKSKSSRNSVRQPSTFDQDSVIDRIVAGEASVDRSAFHPSLSLKPGEPIMWGCILGNEECLAIRDAWMPSFPVTSLPPAEFDVSAT